MLAWSELITDDQKTRNHGYDVIVGGGYLLITRSLQLVTLNPKLKSTGAGRTNCFPLVGYLPQAAWPERLLSESQDAGIAAD